MSSGTQDLSNKLDLAHRAIMTQDLAEVASINRQAIRNQLGQPGEGDVGHIFLGDVTQMTPAAATPAKAGFPWLPLLAGGALMTTGVGSVAGGAMLLNALPAIFKALPQLMPPQNPSVPGVGASSSERLDIDMLIEPPR